MPTLISALSDAVAASPDRIALVFEDQSLTFSELDQHSDALATALLSRGVSGGDRVAILDRNSLWFFVILFAVMKARAVLVTINFRLAPPEVDFIVRDSTSKLLFIGETFVDTLSEHPYPSCDTWVVEQLAQSLNPGVPGQALPAVLAEDAAVQMYTSGTTGLPKGVVLSHSAMVNAATAGHAVWPFLDEADASVLATMPLFHIAACNLGLAALLKSARVDIVNQADPLFVADWLSRHRNSLVPLPATVIHGMLELPDIGDRDFSALRTMLVAGSGIAEELIKRATDTFDCGFALSYGSTETCGGITYLGPEECVQGAGKRLTSAGKVMAPSRIMIQRPDGTPCGANEVGEIVCFSDRLMDEYWGCAEATRAAFRDGGYLSGDAGYMDEAGYLYVVDRIKDMVISGGENIYPAQIEQVFYTHPDVLDAAVIGVPDPHWGEALLAVLVMREHVELDAEAMIDFLRPNLAGYKIPRLYRTVEALPRNATGKVLKTALREQFI